MGRKHIGLTVPTTGNTAGVLRKKPQASYRTYYRQRYHNSSGVLRYLLRAKVPQVASPQPARPVGRGWTEDCCDILARPKIGSFHPFHFAHSVFGCGLSCPATGRRRCSGCRTYLLLDEWVYTTSDDVSCSGTSTTLRGRGLSDRPQKTKTLVVVAEGGNAPAAVGNTRAPRIVAPASTPVDARGA